MVTTQKINRYYYAVLPTDAEGNLNSRKMKTIARICSLLVLLNAIIALVFYVTRVVSVYSDRHEQARQFGETYYGFVAALTCQIGIEAMNVAFAVLLIIGVAKEHTGYLFLWLVSVLVLCSLETVVFVYSVAVKTRGHWHDPLNAVEVVLYVVQLILTIGPIIVTIALYKQICDREEEELAERQILL